MDFSGQLRSLQMESYSLRNMYLVIFVVSVQYFVVGTTFVWTSPMILYLKLFLSLTTFQEVTIIACCPLGMTVGPGLGLVFIDRFGHKSLMWLSLGLNFASLISLSILPNIFGIYLGRVFAGIAIGIVTCHMPDYVDEIAEPEVVTAMKPLTSVAPCLGYLVVYSLGLVLEYHQLLLVYLPGLLVLSVCQIWVPPSPTHCVSTGQIDEAKQVIACLKRGISTNAVEAEIQNIQNKIARLKPLTIQEALHSLSEPTTKYALVLALGLTGLAQLSGATILPSILQSLLLSAKVSGGTSLLCIAAGVLVASMVGSALTARCGYKKSLITASLVMTCSMLVFGLYSLNPGNKMNVSMMSWVTPMCILVYLSAFQLGFTNSTDAIIGKLYNPQFSRFGLTFSTTVGAFLAFIGACTYFPLIVVLGPSSVVWVFTLFCFLAAVFTCLYIPETSQMTTTDIHNFLIGSQPLGALLFKVTSCR